MALSWALHWCFCNFMNCVLCNGYWISFCRAAQASAFHQPLTRKYYILMSDCRLFVFQYGLITMVGGGLTDRWRKTELKYQWTWRGCSLARLGPCYVYYQIPRSYPASEPGDSASTKFKCLFTHLIWNFQRSNIMFLFICYK